MDLLFGESRDADGTWHTVGTELDWNDMSIRGIDVDMVALRQDAFVLALFRGTPTPGSLFEVCVGVPPGEVDEILARLTENATMIESGASLLRFRDPFSFPLGGAAPRRALQEQQRDRGVLDP